jgi:hypothetical protein
MSVSSYHKTIFPTTISMAKKRKLSHIPKCEIKSHQYQHDRSNTGPTDVLNISLRANWTSLDPCSQLIKSERRGKKLAKYFSNEVPSKLQIVWRVFTIRGARAANSLRLPEPKGIGH